MATPSRRDTMIKNLIKYRQSKLKDNNTKEEIKPIDPEDAKRLIALWEKSKKKKDKYESSD